MTTLTLPSPLVNTEWLADNIHHPNIIVLDASSHIPGVPHDALQEQCIPSSRFFDSNHKITDTTSELPHMLPSEKVFTEEARQLGINQDSVIVIYDSAGIFSSPRAWWMLTTMGHKHCAILDGGLPEWLAQGRKTEPRKVTSVAYGNFTAQIHKENIKDSTEVRAAINQVDVCILDARSKTRFDGTAKEPRKGYISGHIPSSKNLPFNQLLDNGKFKPLNDISLLLNEKIKHDQRLYTSCGSGITACVIAFAAHLIGVKNIAVYDGSWCEWGDPKNHLPINSNT
jgi:thiosulfate/3-mercaptopyruvate sulfurtransferase